jgi:arylsulfatase A-like enzyme
VLYCKGSRGRGVSLHQGGWKLLRFDEDERVELYHLAEDPYETTDLAEKEPERVKAMLGLLADEQGKDDSSLPTDPEPG